MKVKNLNSEKIAKLTKQDIQIINSIFFLKEKELLDFF